MNKGKSGDGEPTTASFTMVKRRWVRKSAAIVARCLAGTVNALLCPLL